MTTPNPINITRIDHVVLRVQAMDAMIAFYRDVLGCRLERGPGDLGLAQLRAGDSLIDLLDTNSELGRAGGGPPDHDAPTHDHVCLAVRPWDADTVIAHLDAHGVAHEGVSDRYGASGAGESVYLLDPEGNRVELKQE